MCHNKKNKGKYMINGINHITLSVIDINESFNFYKNVLLLTPIMLSPFSAYFTAGNIWIALQQEKEINRYNNLYSHFAFNVKKDDYKKIIESIQNYRAEAWQENKTEGDSYYFTDPSGNKLEIHYSDLNSRIEYGKNNWGDEVQWFY